MSKLRAWFQLAISVAILFVFSSGAFAQTITCSSDDGNRHHCSADTRGGVRLVKQISGSACQQGYSWGFDREGIWVDHGCRAEFEVAAYQPAGPGGTVSCSSDDGGRHYCQADTRGGVRLVKQRSEAGCQQGYSWGADGRGIWVDHGCRADFAVAAYQPAPPPYGPEAQPDMEQGLRYLRQAEEILSRALSDKGGHRVKAIELIRQAEREVQEGINYANTH